MCLKQYPKSALLGFFIYKTIQWSSFCITINNPFTLCMNTWQITNTVFNLFLHKLIKNMHSYYYIPTVIISMNTTEVSSSTGQHFNMQYRHTENKES